MKMLSHHKTCGVLLRLSTLILATASAHSFAACTYKVTNNWGSGFTGEITVTNDTAAAVNGWSVSWQESGVSVTSAWNATLSGANPYTATSLNWNGALAPKASASFGFQATGKAGAPKVNGTLCGAATAPSSSSKSSVAASASSAKSSAVSSVVKSVSSQTQSSAAAQGSWLFEENSLGFCNATDSVKTSQAGYTGTGYADTVDNADAAIAWSINAAAAKSYAIQFRFANGASMRRAKILVNNSQTQTVDFPATGAWSQWQTLSVNVPLKAGVNSVKIAADTSSGLANVDYISVTGDGITPAACAAVVSSSSSSSSSAPASTASDCNSITNQPILRVAADGSGQYKTVQAALNAISGSNSTPTQIRIKPGTYREKLSITKSNITFCGETGKESSTILTYGDGASTSNGSGGTIGTSGSASVTIKANDISVENITIANSFGVGSQAVALLAQGQRLQFRNCRLLGNQDTLYAHSGTQYYRNCHIQGTVDFIFGGATAVFDNNTIHSVGGGSALTAPSTEQTQPFGLVFLGGKVTAASGVSKGSVALGRNWRPYGAAAYIRTELGQHISAVGWVKMGENTLDTARFSEYLSTGAGANASARASQSKQLTAAQASTYTISNIFGSWTPSYSK